MKALILCLTLVISSSCMERTDQNQFNILWSTLLTASNDEDESTAVDKLRYYLSDNEASYSIYGVDKQGNKYDVQNASFDPKKMNIDSYELQVRQGDGNKVGKGWKPRNPEHIYNFFLE